MAAAPLAAAVSPGTYDGGQTELATRLILKADGSFQYGLSYGALDEQAQGRWVERGSQVLLTTDPRPKPPRFAIVSDTPSADGAIHVALDDSALLQGSSLTVVVSYSGADSPAYVEVDENGRLPVPPGKTVVALVPDLPVYPVPLAPYAVQPGGYKLVFRFEANDIGVAPFDAEALSIEGPELVLRRFDRVIRFRKEPD